MDCQVGCAVAPAPKAINTSAAANPGRLIPRVYAGDVSRVLSYSHRSGRDAGEFWVFSANNLEIVLKVVDGRAVNGHYWVFVASLTDVEFTLEVSDVLANSNQPIHGYQGVMQSFADLTAFQDPP